jgi:hypothetical protein
MSRRLFGQVLMLATAFSAQPAFADHPPYPGHPSYPGQPGYSSPERQVAIEAQNLNYQVVYSNLHYSVKDEVSRFAAHANELSECSIRRIPRDLRCDYARSETLRSFDQIERFLNDTYYSHPAIHQQYLRTRQAIDVLRFAPNPGPGPIPGRPLRATGLLDMIHFRFEGYSAFEIQNQCLNLGYRNGLRHVRGVVVNGRRFGGGYGQLMNIGQACGLVAQNAY